MSCQWIDIIQRQYLAKRARATVHEDKAVAHEGAKRRAPELHPRQAGAKVDESLDVPTTLSERLCALEVSEGKYAKKRKGALRDVTELRKEYLEYCATVGSEEAAAAAAAAEEEGAEDQDSDDSSDWDPAVGACMVGEEPEEGEEGGEEEGMEVLEDELGGYPSDTALAAGVEEGDKEEGEDEGMEEGMGGVPNESQQSDLWSDDDEKK